MPKFNDRVAELKAFCFSNFELEEEWEKIFELSIALTADRIVSSWWREFVWLTGDRADDLGNVVNIATKYGWELDLKTLSWGRIRHDLKKGIKKGKIGYLDELVDFVVTQVPGTLKGDSFRSEMLNGFENTVLSYCYFAHIAPEIESDEVGFRFSEQWCPEGHNLHPSAKTKLALSWCEVMRYSPEFLPEFSLCWALIESEVYETFGVDLLEVFEENHLELVQELKKVMACYPEGKYHLVPFHPWQKEWLQKEYSKELEPHLIWLDLEHQMKVWPTTSFRTLCSKEGLFALKVAVTTFMTSTVRSISYQTAANASRVDEVMTRVLQDPVFKRWGGFAELAGGAWSPRQSQPWKRDLTYVLRVLPAGLREKRIRSLSALVQPVPWSLPSQGGNWLKSLVAFDQRELWWDRYLDLVIAPCLYLWWKYGIALEAHLQNSLLELDETNSPKAFWIRDWGGLRIYRDRLASCGFEPELAQGSLTITDCSRQARKKLHYCLVQNHLVELALVLGEREPERVSLLLEKVEEKMREAWELHSDVLTVEERKQELHFWSSTVVEHKALLTMKLVADQDHYVYIPNPLPLKHEIRH